MKSVSVEEMIDKIDEILEESEPSADTGVVAAPTGPATPILPNQHFEIGMTTFQSPCESEFRLLPDAETDTVRYEPLRSAPMNPFSPENPEIERLYQNAVERHIHSHGDPPNPFQAQTLRRHAECEHQIEQEMLNRMHRDQLRNETPNHNPLLTLEELIEKLENQTEASIYQECVEKYMQLTGEPPDATISEILKSLAFREYHHGQRYLSFLQNPPVWSHPEGAQLNRLGELFEVAREADETDAAYRERIRQRAYPNLT